MDFEINNLKKRNLLIYKYAFLFSYLAFFSELALSRIFSFVHISHRPLDVLPVALVGMSIGALFPKETKKPTDTLEGSLQILPICLFVLLLGPLLGANILFHTIVSLPIFILCGFVLSFCFVAGETKRVYTVELLGGTLGLLSGILLMPTFSLENSLLGFSFLASLLFLNTRKSIFTKGALLILTLAALVFHLVSNQIDMIKSYDIAGIETPRRGKMSATQGHILARNYESEIVGSSWSNLARVDIIKSKYRPWTGNENKEPSYSVFFDNELFSEIPQPWWPKNPRPSQIYLNLPDKLKIAIIGVGAAPEVISIKESRSLEVTGVEVNSGVIKLVKQLSQSTESPYKNFDHFYTLDGRYYIHNSKQSFDVIDLSAVSSNISAARSINVDDYLFTTDAIKDYLAHLKAGGLFVSQLSFPKDETKFFRFLNMTSEALVDLGKKPENHLLVYEHLEDSIWNNRTSFFVISNNEWTNKDLNYYDKTIEDDSRLRYLIRPGSNGALQTADSRYKDFLGRIDIPSYQKHFQSKFGGYIESPTDNKPFFGMLYDNNVNPLKFVYLALALFLMAFFCSSIKNKKEIATLGQRESIFFITSGLLGAGYSLLHLISYKGFSLFIGVPNLCFLASTIGLILGSVLANQSPFLKRSPSNILLATSIFYIFLLDHLSPALENFIPFTWIWVRVLIGIVLLTPLGFLVSTPYIQILRSFDGTTKPLIKFAYAFNTLMFTLFYGIAQQIALSFGFHFLSYLLVVIYLGVVLLNFTTKKATQLSIG